MDINWDLLGLVFGMNVIDIHGIMIGIYPLEIKHGLLDS